MPPSPRVPREDIAAAALRTLDEVGVDGLSMRKLAAELGLGTMSLYHHFADKDALVGAAIDLAIVPLDEARVADVQPGRPRVRRAAFALYEVLRAHPWAHGLRRSGPFLRLSTLGIGETIVAGLREAGVSEPNAARGNILILEYISGAATTPVMVDNAEQGERLRKALASDDFRGLRETHVAAVGEWGRSYTRRGMLEPNLDLILDALGAAPG